MRASLSVALHLACGSGCEFREGYDDLVVCWPIRLTLHPPILADTHMSIALACQECSMAISMAVVDIELRMVPPRLMSLP